MATAVATASNGLPYVGNQDFRGYLNALATNGDPYAAALIGSQGNTGLVGNNGSVDQGLLSNFVSSPADGSASPAGQTVLGQTEQDRINNINNYAKSAYATYQKGGVLGASGGTSGTSNTNAADLAYLDSQDASLRDQLTRAQTGLDQGLTQIGDTYNLSANRAAQDKNTADTGFNTQRDQTTQDKLKAVDTINTNARTLADSVRRQLGLASGSDSSAYQIAAPSAIARDTTTKRVGVNDTFGRNYDSINNANTATDLKFDRAAEDLLAQRKAKEEGLRSGVLQQQNDISSQLGQDALTRAEINGGSFTGTSAALQPIQDSITQRQNAIDALFAQYRTPYTLADTAPVAANLDTYQTPTTNINTTPTASSVAAPASNDLSAQLALALKKFQGAGAAAPVAASTA